MLALGFGRALAATATAEGTSLSLRDAVERALRDAPTAKIAALEADQADAAADAARSIYWPQAGMRSQAGWSDQQNSTLDAINGRGQLKRYPLTTLGASEPWISVYFDQILFDLKRWHDVERSELEAEAAAVGRAREQESLSYAVLQHYIEVVHLEELHASDRQRLVDAEWLDRQAASLLEGGRALPNEREQAAIDLEQAKMAADATQVRLEAARAALGEAIGADAADGLTLAVDAGSLPKLDLGAAEADVDAQLADAPELRILALRKRMEEIAVQAARAAYYPTIGVRGGYFHYGTKRFNSFQEEVAVGVDVNVPFFDGFRTSSSIDAATKAAEAAHLRYDSLRNDKRSRVRELQRAVRTAGQEGALAERRAKAATQRQKLADLSLQAQRGTLASALQAHSEQARDARGAIDGRWEGLRIWAALQREVGHLTALLTGEAAAGMAKAR